MMYDDDIKLSHLKTDLKGGCQMNYTDILLVAIACMSIPMVCAIFFDAFYAEKKRRSFSLKRVSCWYALFFALSFVPTVIFIVK